MPNKPALHNAMWPGLVGKGDDEGCDDTDDDNDDDNDDSGSVDARGSDTDRAFQGFGLSSPSKALSPKSTSAARASEDREALRGDGGLRRRASI